MAKTVWDDLKFFKKQEFNEPDKMNTVLIVMIDLLREKFGKPLKVTASYSTSGHSEKSEHYNGNAVDLVPVSISDRIEIIDLFLIAEKLGFNGIGLYAWGFPGTFHNPGIHLDMGGIGRRWALNENETKYCDLNSKYIKRIVFDPRQKIITI